MLQIKQDIQAHLVTPVGLLLQATSAWTTPLAWC